MEGGGNTDLSVTDDGDDDVLLVTVEAALLPSRIKIFREVTLNNYKFARKSEQKIFKSMKNLVYTLLAVII